MKYDLLLKRGHVIDPLNNVNEVNDVAISKGKIAAVASNIDSSEAVKVIDISGLYLTPGLVDIHCHLYPTTGMRGSWAGDLSVFPDGFSFRSGITTMVDAGSAGAMNFDDFRERVIDRSLTRVLAFINIISHGMVSDSVEQNINEMNPSLTAKMALKNRDVVVGIKTAHYQGPEWIAVEKAIEAGTKAGMPIMVDFGYFRKERPYYRLVTEKLRPGDITTHMYIGAIPYVDENQNLLDYLKTSRKRGVMFDVGHGGGSFVFRNAAASVKCGFYPDTISTDLHVLSMNSAMMDMTTVLSKFLAIGIPLSEVIKECTINAARIIGHHELGQLSVGAIADIAVLNLIKGNFGYYDVAYGKVEFNQRLLCEMTIKDGKIVWDWNARNGVDYRELTNNYGVRPVDNIIIPVK
jgi:dihydroorotase